MSRKFWNWVRNDNEDRILILNGEISNETWYGDEITPQIFRSELNSGQGKVTVWINSPLLLHRFITCSWNIQELLMYTLMVLLLPLLR